MPIRLYVNMKRLRMNKAKLSPDLESDKTNNGSGNGLFNKISSRYATLSNKLTRRHQPQCRSNSTSPKKNISGSYDMSGFNSEEYRLEIGAPVLVSSTTFDTDRFDVGLAKSMNIVDASNLCVRDDHVPSSSSDNEIYVDALSSTPITKKNSIELNEKLLCLVREESLPKLDSKNHTLSKRNLQYSFDITRLSNTSNVEKPSTKACLLQKQYSKSEQNVNCLGTRMICKKSSSSDCQLPKICITKEDANCENYKQNFSSSRNPKIRSEPHTPLYDGDGTREDFKSRDSLDILRNNVQRRNLSLNDESTNDGSNQSLAVSHSSRLNDFNFDSVSCQSFNEQSLFVSIDELNEITRQINEAEEFNQIIDLEYCKHRDNLKPNERRITLLKNKNGSIMNLLQNKDKLKKGWHDVKHWIEGESSKIKEVIQKQTPLQRIAESELNLSRENATGGDSSTMVSTLHLENINSKSEIDNNQNDEKTCTLESSSSKRPRREEQDGFEELRRYVKQGDDYGKELIMILQERVESEMIYSKSLSKMATKLNKACCDLPGSIANAWRSVATEMQSRSEIHRQLSTSLTDEVVKPLKSIVDGHHKTRKTVENGVDKAARVLAEWRVSQAKAKKNSHAAARENEKVQDAMLDVRIQKSPSVAVLHQSTNKLSIQKEIKSAEKDCVKLDNKRKKTENAVKRADVEYYTLCVRAERARVDWEMSVLRGSSVLQSIENQRLINMKNYVTNYTVLTANMNPLFETLVQRLQPQIGACNVNQDMEIIKNIERNTEGPSEQYLPDFYCEHTTLAMNRERRKHALIKLLQLVKSDLERERRSHNCIKGLSQSLNNHDDQNITDKLYHIRSMLTYLEGTRFKLHSALLELDHKPQSSHPLSQHIQVTRDRTGLQQSVLRVPLWLKRDNLNACTIEEAMPKEHEYDVISQDNTSSNNVSSNCSKTKSNVSGECAKPKNRPKENVEDPYYDRGQADGGSNEQDSDFDESSSQDDVDDCSAHRQRRYGSKNTEGFYQNTTESQLNVLDGHNSNGLAKPVILGRYKALYSYTPKLYDELELTPGDIIEVHAKQDDGWWLGALGERIGIFPATYVEVLT